MNEKELSAELRATLDRLGSRCVYHTEVGVACWTHGLRKQADRLRIDYALELDGRLLGIEVKAPPDKCADLGRDLLQCAQYAAGYITSNRAEVPQSWIGRPFEAVFLCTRAGDADDMLLDHFRSSHRLFGPSNVGLVMRERRGLCLRLCAARFWTEWSGYHQGMLRKGIRVGNSTVSVGE